MEDFQVLFSRRNVACKEPLNVKRIKDIAYRTANNEEYHCDIYLPQEIADNKKLPVVYMVHGEAPARNIKDMGEYISTGEFIASKGMAAVTFNHRMLNTGSMIDDVLDDIAQVRNFISSGSGRFNFDTAGSCIWSISSGMPFGLYNALNYKPEDVKCIVGYYGFGDFASVLKLFPDRQNTGGVIPEIMTAGTGTPMLIVRAGLDFEIVHDSMDRFIMKCLELNANINLYNHSTGQHAFDILDDNERSSELINKTVEFIRRHLQYNPSGGYADPLSKGV